MDNLKAVLVAWVIGGHALLGYSAVGGWPYDEVNEVQFQPDVEVILKTLLGPTGLFMMGTFFFVAGLFLPRSLRRRGPARFARERVLRLGVPFLVSALVIWPVSMWVAYRSTGRDVSVAWVFVHRDPLLDSGALWFAEILLIFSLVCALGLLPPGRELTGRRLLGWAAGIAAATFVVRLGFPARSGQVGDLHIWQWPQLAGMFVLGILAGLQGWESRVPDRLWRACRTVLLGVAGLLPVYALLAGRVDLSSTSGVFLGGLHWQSLLSSTLEGTVVVAGSVWLLGAAQRRLTGTGPLHRFATRGAFAAFVLQGPVLIGWAVALRPWDVPAELKAPLVAAGAIATAFTLGWLLAGTRAGRILGSG